MVGRTLQRYRLVEEVGHGGMAVVYRGIDEGLERPVAVKLLHPHLSSRVEHRRRLVREAKAVARLRHPNILEIFDFSGEDSAEAYIVTELIQGPTLRAFANDHPFDPPELAAACVYVLAGALAHAHAHGIVHRDIKPDNVMIQCSGSVPVIKLMDFGIAQLVDRDERMTMTGSLMGSPAHMAPEIIDGEEADERSDIFSLGTILYSLVTGALPFEAANPGALLKKILAGDYTDPRILKPSVSDQLARVMADSLARDRNQRIPTALALQERLGEALTRVGIDRPEELLNQFLAHPEDTARATQAIVVAHLMEEGRVHAQQRHIGKALAAYARVMAVVPGTPEAGAARQAIDRLSRRRRWRRRLMAVAAGVGVALIGMTARAWWLSRPVATGPAVVPTAIATPRPPSTASPPASPPPRASAPPPVPQAGTAGISSTTVPKVQARREGSPGTASGEQRGGEPRHGRHSLTDDAQLPGREHVRLASNDPSRARHREAPAPAGEVSPLVSVTIPRDAETDPWAFVYLDGKQIGATPFSGELPAGDHVIQLIGNHGCCVPISRHVTFFPGRPFVMARERFAPLPPKLRIHLHGPPDTQITVNDEPRTYGGLPPDGILDVRFKGTSDGKVKYDQDVTVVSHHEGYQDDVQTFTVKAGEVRDVNIDMVPSR